MPISTFYLHTECGRVSQLVVVNGYWKTYALRHGGEAAYNLTFFAGHLRQLTCVKIDVPNDQWDTSQELKQKAYWDRFLRSTLGKPPYNYAWGSVESFYDVRTYSAQIIINYKN